MRSKPAPVADPSALIRRALGLCRMLRNWPPEVLDELTALSRLGRYERHQQVRAADPKRREVLVVASGCVEVGGVDATGSRFVLSMHSAGDIVGLARLLEHTQFVYDYHAHQSTVLVEIPGESFLALLDAHPLLWKDICLLVLARMHELIVVQQRHAFSNIDNRVAELLARLAPTHGQPAPDGQGVVLRISQSDLAAMLSVSRQTINKELRLLEQRGLLQAAYGRLTLVDLAGLGRAAAAGPAMGQ